ncbi:hypothetical protein F7R91_02750 [Streptomyces luteolifulvus]|uniref:Uncharacterized protein n=1 Tax=Streptomyces luteolifulvus TaxID=2615112 RepID=A0A6H9V6S3_9ACTN|nr:hypothetical protein F7R91_02750 [Streptomyces luteolifulvus]
MSRMTCTPKPKENALMELPSEPGAVPGCSECLDFCARRESARSEGDYSGVSDAHVELRRHRAEAHSS